MLRLFVMMAGWAYGDCVTELGNPDFRSRLAAHQRLSRAGWLAYPVLLGGAQSDCQERAARCAELCEALDGPFWRALEADSIARGAESLPEGADAPLMKLVCAQVDRLGGWVTDNAWGWAKVTPYSKGSLTADVAHVVGTAVAARAATAVPHSMPAEPKK